MFENFKEVTKEEYHWTNFTQDEQFIKWNDSRNAFTDVNGNPIYVTNERTVGAERRYRGYTTESQIYDKRVDGYTTLMIDLFYFNNHKHEEMKVEQSINEIVQKFHSLLIERK